LLDSYFGARNNIVTQIYVFLSYKKRQILIFVIFILKFENLVWLYYCWFYWV